MTKRQDRDAIYVKRQFDTEIIVLCVRWYITYRLSYRDLVAMMAERGVPISHTTIMRWVLLHENRLAGPRIRRLCAQSVDAPEPKATNQELVGHHVTVGRWS